MEEGRKRDGRTEWVAALFLKLVITTVIVIYSFTKKGKKEGRKKKERKKGVR